MRLVVFGPGHPFRGGIARTTTELVHGLREAGHEVRFLSATRQYPPLVYPGASDRDPEAVPKVADAVPCLDPAQPLRWRRARRLAKATAADAWILPYWTWVWAPLWRYLLATPRRPPVVAVVHNPVDHDAGRLRRLVARGVLARCDGLFTHAAALVELLEEQLPGKPVAHHLLPAGPRHTLPTRESARTALGLPADARVALFLGLIRPYKGVDVLVDAWADPRVAADWHLVVAGEPWGGAGAGLERQVARHGLAGRVHLRLGWVRETEVPPLLAAADIVVLPYRDGSQSAVAPLALAHGVPVLTTAVGGLPELVSDGVDGRVVAPGDAGALVGSLLALDHEELARLAAGAAAPGPSWRGYAAELVRLLERLR